MKKWSAFEGGVALYDCTCLYHVMVDKRIHIFNGREQDEKLYTKWSTMFAVQNNMKKIAKKRLYMMKKMHGYILH